MAQCRGVHLLLLLFAVFLSCLDISLAASADAITTIQVDGVNVTIDNEVCEVAGWRVSFDNPAARSSLCEHRRLLDHQHNL